MIDVIGDSHPMKNKECERCERVMVQYARRRRCIRCKKLFCSRCGCWHTHSVTRKNDSVCFDCEGNEVFK